MTSCSRDTSFRFYRVAEQRRIVAGLLAGQSLLVASETGLGKTTLGLEVRKDLEERGFKVVFLEAGSPTAMTQAICDQLDLETVTLEGKRKSLSRLREDIEVTLANSKHVIFIFDNSERLEPKLRAWVFEITGLCPVLLLATTPPKRDLFIKIPRLELEPLLNSEIREIMEAEAERLGLLLKRGDLAEWQARVAGNPALAKRAIREEHLGLKSDTLVDHTQWIDGTPFLIAALCGLTILRFLGLGFNSTSLYLMGGILTVTVGILRLLYYSLPKAGNRLGGR